MSFSRVNPLSEGVCPNTDRVEPFCAAISLSTREFGASSTATLNRQRFVVGAT